MWKYPWIRNDQCFYVQFSCPEGLENLRVADLLQDENRNWDEGLLSYLFDPSDIQRIKQTVVGPIGARDTLMCHFSREGTYSVKSGYDLASSMTIDSYLQVHGNWKIIWQLAVPPKSRIVYGVFVGTASRINKTFTRTR